LKTTLEIQKLQQHLADVWHAEPIETTVNASTRGLLNDAGDWDAPIGIKPKRPTIPLAIGIPDSTSLPKEALGAAANRVFNKPGEGAFTYGFGLGYNKLRLQLAENYSRERRFEVTEDWFQLCNGSSGAIDLICRTLIDPGDVILAESPTYMGTLRNFKALNAEVESIGMDSDGMLVERLPNLIDTLLQQGKRIKFIYTISNFHNPTGATLSLERKIRLLEIAAQYKILILDDDAYGALRFDDTPLPTLSGLSKGHGVITVGTFSKILATGLRIGWIHCHPDLLDAFNKMRFAMGLNQFMVRVISDYIDSGAMSDHAHKVRHIYKLKMNTLADALEKHCADYVDFTRPLGGFYIWISLKQGLEAEAVWRTAAEEGVSLTRGTNFFPNRIDDKQHLRLAFSWTDPDQLIDAATRLKHACERILAGDPA
jgi:2-aminoadipate transaminase